MHLTQLGSKSLALALLVGIAIAGSQAAFAGETKVTLTGQEETPPVTTTATGKAKIAVGADKKISGSVQTSGVEGTAAHIHAGAPGEKGPPVVTLTSSGPGVWTVPETVLTDDQYASYKAGKLYINVHSAANKGGEIRGQIKP